MRNSLNTVLLEAGLQLRPMRQATAGVRGGVDDEPDVFGHLAERPALSEATWKRGAVFLRSEPRFKVVFHRSLWILHKPAAGFKRQICTIQRARRFEGAGR